jgi:hypothetical protein
MSGARRLRPGRTPCVRGEATHEVRPRQRVGGAGMTAPTKISCWTLRAIVADQAPYRSGAPIGGATSRLSDRARSGSQWTSCSASHQRAFGRGRRPPPTGADASRLLTDGAVAAGGHAGLDNRMPQSRPGSTPTPSAHGARDSAALPLMVEPAKGTCHGQYHRRDPCRRRRRRRQAPGGRASPHLPPPRRTEVALSPRSSSRSPASAC